MGRGEYYQFLGQLLRIAIFPSLESVSIDFRKLDISCPKKWYLKII